MADVFLSYSSGNRETAAALAAALAGHGYSVWWDRQIVTGERFDSVIEVAAVVLLIAATGGYLWLSPTSPESEQAEFRPVSPPVEAVEDATNTPVEDLAELVVGEYFGDVISDSKGSLGRMKTCGVMRQPCTPSLSTPGVQTP